MLAGVLLRRHLAVRREYTHLLHIVQTGRLGDVDEHHVGLRAAGAEQQQRHEGGTEAHVPDHPGGTKSSHVVSMRDTAS